MAQNAETCPVYQIRLAGEMDSAWASWLNGLSIRMESTQPAVTSITGEVVDQTRLRGILNQLWDLNRTILSVIRLEE
jgi:hypothetical protein